MAVKAHAELTKVDGRTLTFRVWAEDTVEPISEGTHERIIITLARFDERMQKKKAGEPSVKVKR